MKKTIIWIIVLALLGFGVYYFMKGSGPKSDVMTGDENSQMENSTTTDEAMMKDENPGQSVIGKSVEGRDITAYHYGTGTDEILFVGGLHGGYEWNTSLVAYELMDYLSANQSAVPANEKVTVIPVSNPDGLYKTTGKDGRFTASDVPTGAGATVSGRFNANNVDLNRNFDCDWQAKGTWQDKTVSGGDSAFSEPESQALRDYVASSNPKAVVVWYSSAGGVFSSSCHDGVLDETNNLTNIFAKASGYKPYEEFNFYEVTGDMVNWLAKIKVPAISVLLTNHTDTEWSKNKAGIEAVLNHYASSN